ncbi:MAG TPA: tetratricopeptide repeat protein [Clostridiales bacterium]|nr:tetratricopeptide repeat protein [Clostridiales bacterium]HQP69141.1 tetratricopeptide repeat protein [Clostridiales bacterium]
MKILIFNKDKRQLDPFNERIKKTLDQIEQANQYEIVSDKEKLHQVIEYSNPEIVIIDEGYELGEKPYSPAKAFFRRNKILIFVITIFSILLPFIYFSYSYKADVLESKLNETRSEMDIYFDDMIEQALYSMSLKKYSDIDVILKFKIINLNPSKKYIVEALKSASKQFTKLQFLASSLREKRDYMDMIEESIKLDPDYYLAYVCKAVLGYSTYRDSIFLKDYKMAIDLEPDKSSNYAHRGTLYYNEGNYMAALEDFFKSVNIDSSNIISLNNIGLSYFKMKDFRKSLDYYNRAINIDSTNWYVYANRALLYIENNNLIKAENDMHKAIIIDSINPMTLTTRAYYTLTDSKINNIKINKSSFLNDIDYAISLDPSYYKAYIVKASYYSFIEKDYDTAIKIYDFLINAVGEVAFLYHNKAMILSSSGDHANSILELKKAASIDNESSYYIDIGDEFKEGLNDIDSAKYYYMRSIGTNSNLNAIAYTNLAHIFFEANILDSALNYINNAINCDRFSSRAYSLSALINFGLNRDRKAIDDISKAIKYDLSNDRRLYAFRGSFYKFLKEYDKAINDLKIASNINNNEIRSENLFELGKTYYEYKNIDSALHYMQKASLLNSKYVNEYNRIQGLNDTVKLYINGRRMFEKDSIQKSIIYFTKAIDIYNKHPYYYFYRCLAYSKSYEFDYATKDLIKFKEYFHLIKQSDTYDLEFLDLLKNINQLVESGLYFGLLLRSELYKYDGNSEKSKKDRELAIIKVGSEISNNFYDLIDSSNP